MLEGMDWQDIQLFLAAHEHGSLSAAARALKLGQATMSRRLATLEEAIGHQLFIRARAGLSLTPAGQAMLPHAQEMARRSADLQAALEELGAEPQGWVRIALPPGSSTDYLAPLLPAFTRRWPLIRLEIRESTALADLDRQEADLAIRTVRPTRGDQVFQRLSTTTMGLYASADYLRRLPASASLQDLDYIAWPDDFSEFAPMRWLRDQGCLPRVNARCNGILTQRAAALAGFGALLIDPRLAEFVGLQRVPIPHPPLPTLDTYLLIPASLVNVARVRAVAGFVRKVIEFVDLHHRLPTGEHDLDDL